MPPGRKPEPIATAAAIAAIVEENGKTRADAEGDVFRGLECVEAATGLAHYMLGDTLGQLAADTDTYTYRQPLGVTASICPFNFPVMVPLWSLR